ncbi:HK97 family phage prohead protease [Nitratireductor rhodophyticola]|uniref:HK97 family phage prohead protease n=1 Tax=Nitratireductor rhodophyticola TaxID=2854036 RepID=UPI002AC8C163|nr:HK97 family phage prohead protease [Nitratireductor rhodophyticola]WPZ13627.1 HK97 family phage prohead protease [Nitratireductor rhodophyticola]
MTTIDRKAAPVELDVKEVSDDGSFSGYASVFGVKDSYAEIVMPGAFTKSLTRYPAARVKMLWQHDRTEPIGVWTSFTEDSHGLKATGRILLETTRGREVHALMKAGAVDGLSIGFRTIRDSMDRAKGARLLHEVELREVSIVSFPANEEATVTTVKHTNNQFSELVAAINAARTTIAKD